MGGSGIIAFPFPLSSFTTGISADGRGLMDAEYRAGDSGTTGRPSRAASVADLLVTSRMDREEGEAGIGARVKAAGTLSLKLGCFASLPKASVV